MLFTQMSNNCANDAFSITYKISRILVLVVFDINARYTHIAYQAINLYLVRDYETQSIFSY